MTQKERYQAAKEMYAAIGVEHRCCNRKIKDNSSIITLLAG